MKKYNSQNANLSLNWNNRNKKIALILEKISNNIFYFKRKRKPNINN